MLIIAGLVILAVVILLLALPLEIEILAQVHGRAEVAARLKWLFGLITWNLQPAARPHSETSIKSPDEQDAPLISQLFDAVRTEGLWEQIRRLLNALQGHVRLSSVDSDFRVSLGDDYYTGMLAGLFIPLTLILNQGLGADVRIVPLFEDELILDGYLKGTLGVRPIEVIVPCLAFMCAPSVRQARRLF